MEWCGRIIININDMYSSSSDIYGMGTKINWVPRCSEWVWGNV